MDNFNVDDVILKFVDEHVFDVRDNVDTSYTEQNQLFQTYISEQKRNEPKKYKIKEELEKTDLQYIQRQRFLNIDSNDRNMFLYPNPNNYIIDVTSGNFCNIIEVQLVSCYFEQTGVDIPEKYMIMSSNTLKGDFSLSNHYHHDAFAKIYLIEREYDSFTAGHQQYLQTATMLNKLSEIDITFKYNNGDYANFKNDMDEYVNHSFVLKITEIHQKRKKTPYNSRLGIHT
jgi:hypothetical protein